jgi:hypothetical protein
MYYIIKLILSYLNIINNNNTDLVNKKRIKLFIVLSKYPRYRLRDFIILRYLLIYYKDLLVTLINYILFKLTVLN